MFQLPQGTAIFMILFATFMWGSWFQCIKRLGKYPVSGFILLMYSFSFILVWGFIGLFGKSFLADGILAPIAAMPDVALEVVVCGALFAAGMQIQMNVVKRVGIILSVSITATCNILFGTVIAAFVGGIRDNVSITLLMIAALVLVTATVICQIAGKRRAFEKGGSIEGNEEVSPKMVASLILVMLFLASAYPLAMSLGVKTELHPRGFEPLLCVGLLSFGSLIGSWIYSSVVLTKKKLWRATFRPENKAGIWMALISAFAHYGGNIIHTIAIPVVSVAIAWPMGTTSNIWSYIWGLGYGEFKGCSKKTYAILFSGMILFFAGVVLLAINMYW